MSDEIHPFVVYRVADGRLECALWQLKDGPTALALFLSEESANAYRNAAGLGTEWRVLRPTKEDLWQVLKEYHRAGVRAAVLDPDREAAKRLFDIDAIVGKLTPHAAPAQELYHLVPRQIWEQIPDGPYRAGSLASDGFIHCSYRDQVEKVANLFYIGEADLYLLCIDGQKLNNPVRAEDAGTGEHFPHVYGPIDRQAVRAVVPMRRDGQGRWVLPDLPEG